MIVSSSMVVSMAVSKAVKKDAAYIRQHKEQVGLMQGLAFTSQQKPLTCITYCGNSAVESDAKQQNECSAVQTGGYLLLSSLFLGSSSFSLDLQISLDTADLAVLLGILLAQAQSLLAQIQQHLRQRL